MGCPLSKLHFECPRPNPRIFQVWNIDSEGRNVKPGKIEVTEAQLVLYQKGDITVRWPLRSLRRYGFDAELFSFECGRRCPTGPGVYAFRCQRAEVLFNVLQECIQNSGGAPGNVSMSAIDDQMNLGSNAVAVRSPPMGDSLANGTAGNHHLVSGVDSSGYLEPISGGSSHAAQYPQILSSNSQSSHNVSTTQNSSPGGIVCIHPARGAGGSASVAWSSQLPPSLPTSCSFGSSTHTRHNYVNGVAERMISTSAYPSGLCVVHQYVNSSDLDHSPRCFSSRGWYERSGSSYVNSSVAALPSPPPPPPPPPPPLSAPVRPEGFHPAIRCVDVNTNYAKLDDLLKQEQSAKKRKEEEEEEEEEEPCYVNVKPEQQSQKTAGIATSNKSLSDRSTPSDFRSLRRPSALTFSKGSVQPKSCNSRLYVNLRSGSVKNSIGDISEPEDSPKMHYAVLDLDQNSEVPGSGSSTSATVSQTFTSRSKDRHSVPSSLSRTHEGYVQIDFDRTVALSHSANPCPLNDESIRRTRHNATKPCSSTSS